MVCQIDQLPSRALATSYYPTAEDIIMEAKKILNFTDDLLCNMINYLKEKNPILKLMYQTHYLKDLLMNKIDKVRYSCLPQQFADIDDLLQEIKNL